MVTRRNNPYCNRIRCIDSGHMLHPDTELFQETRSCVLRRKSTFYLPHAHIFYSNGALSDSNGDALYYRYTPWKCPGCNVHHYAVDMTMLQLMVLPPLRSACRRRERERVRERGLRVFLL